MSRAAEPAGAVRPFWSLVGGGGVLTFVGVQLVNAVTFRCGVITVIFGSSLANFPIGEPVKKSV